MSTITVGEYVTIYRPVGGEAGGGDGRGGGGKRDQSSEKGGHDDGDDSDGSSLDTETTLSDPQVGDESKKSSKKRRRRSKGTSTSYKPLKFRRSFGPSVTPAPVVPANIRTFANDHPPLKLINRVNPIYALGIMAPPPRHLISARGLSSRNAANASTHQSQGGADQDSEEELMTNTPVGFSGFYPPAPVRPYTHSPYTTAPQPSSVVPGTTGLATGPDMGAPWVHTSAENYRASYEARNDSVRKGKKHARELEEGDKVDDE